MTPPIDDLEALRGDLDPDFPLDQLEWWKLQLYAREAVLAQRHDVRGAALDTLDGEVLDLDLAPIRLDENGVAWLTVRWREMLLLRLSVDRLLPGVPLRLRDLRAVADG